MSFIGDIFSDLTGATSAEAARESAGIQEQFGQEAIGEVRGAGERALGFLEPFGAVGQQGLAQAGFLGDPQAQFEFLQNNPLFQLALENANQQTGARSAARGRLSAGDTLEQLSQNVLLSASPLIDRQRQDIFGQLGFGAGIAGQQAGIERGTGFDIASLLTDIGATRGGGIVGAANARQGGLSNLINLGGTIAGFTSPQPRLRA